VTTVTLARTTAPSIDVDLLIVGLRPGASGPSVIGLATSERAAREDLEAAFAAVGASGKAGAASLIPAPTSFAATAVLGIGLGEAVRGGAKGRRIELLRRAAGAAVRQAPDSAGRLAVALGATDADQLAAVAQGAMLGAYRYTRFKADPASAVPERTITVVSATADRSVRVEVERALTVATEVLRARDLVNAPPSHLAPEDFAALAAAAAQDASLQVEILDEHELAEAGFGGITAVGQGSANPPRLVRIAYRPRGAKQHLALVGKGVTFDSGGLSLKPPTAMETMKCDMAGAAAALGATLAIAALKTKVSVTTYLPLVENMPSGTAQRPGDVITAYGGRTVEVLNTDAEGRLILMDAIVRAHEDAPDVIIDIATLTGAQMVALGSQVAGAMGNDDTTRQAVVDAGAGAGEMLWGMPLPEELRASLDSPVADIKNIGDRFGGMLTAGLFLKEFVADGQKWVHLDIAGPAFIEGGARDYCRPGGTGFGVRTLVAYAQKLAAR
jgi:leucyl aminopeptidase